MTVATATKPVAPRKRRTRKVAVKTVKVTKPTVKTVKRPSAAKLISPQRYWSDIKTRWSIHQYEITMLAADLTKLNKYVRQFTKWPLRPHTGSFFVIIKKWDRVQSFWTRHTWHPWDFGQTSAMYTSYMITVTHVERDARQGWATIQMIFDHAVDNCSLCLETSCTHGNSSVIKIWVLKSDSTPKPITFSLCHFLNTSNCMNTISPT